MSLKDSTTPNTTPKNKKSFTRGVILDANAINAKIAFDNARARWENEENVPARWNEMWSKAEVYKRALVLSWSNNLSSLPSERVGPLRELLRWEGEMLKAELAEGPPGEGVREELHKQLASVNRALNTLNHIPEPRVAKSVAHLK